jgi:UDP-N-acetylglucosamine--N-acetylmuramyl-(pentapeptide) pyrophosphoryl-undecaprenol N-acetylglucosamine transferase
MSSLRVLIATGGTGGHVYPALAVATELRRRGHWVGWLGAQRGMESQVVAEADIPFYRVAAQGVRGKHWLVRVRGLIMQCCALLQALWILLRVRPQLILGMGGYVSVPGGLAAALLRRPLAIHEQNAVVGSANRLLSRFARIVFAGFPVTLGRAVSVRHIGNPVRSDLLDAAQSASYDYAAQRPFRVLVMGGSLGAEAINRVLPGAWAAFTAGGEWPAELRHQTGRAHFETVREAYIGQAAESIELLPYIDAVTQAYLWADLVVCRAGALTLAELALLGRPAVLIPLPNAIDNHQARNAQVYVDGGAALVLPQAALSGESLAELLQSLAAEPARLQAMSAAARQLAFPDATRDLCDALEGLADAR